ncbi:1-acyl-sn-glycerol-3-phosphate acyltransferase [Cereibacter sphaeroides]|uniref:lysophospholipid acyltransferase family protein n=1 Tax=Cereibacter sphaeroides TaxID=1063 RepID=UPI001F1E0910|nr:lysophospholipid acyltransferase family protein [Cereibacter sphaeroides]MCE6949581.1 1-acyl-sn-glycerol-3-phosphate acyltransferase [Cereibacter sphaeroides]MCE6957608.1 1-acyl-sn-glycerol-3-phosphate acyltransferase [Cereibacter sphaeroides]MCE6967223.1 1-acyl-sn-glycerol-3-phosphate acyltransferase [Cereibacter sphaeroides]MCE6971388.1 1-acyl-sn-glycerol-3-phosphate acyltransferase [Cereibacter sphaeroides]
MSDWRAARMEPARIGPAGWLRVAWKGPAMAAVVYAGLALLLLVRLVEAPVCGRNRPITPWITQGVCRAALAILGLRCIRRGRAMAVPGAVVANHGSWLDIFTLNAAQRIYFVSKSEVAGWPGIGWLARATGTVFINRKGSEAKAQQQLFEERLRAGHRLLFFPEGTSTDTLRILPFKSTLFAAFFTHGLEHVLHIQPVTVRYTAPQGEDPRFYGWWGDMDFGSHLLKLLAAPRHGQVEITFHDPVPADGFDGRKGLAAHCEARVRSAWPG